MTLPCTLQNASTKTVASTNQFGDMTVSTVNTLLNLSSGSQSSYDPRCHKPIGVTDEQFKRMLLDKCANSEIQASQLESLVKKGIHVNHDVITSDVAALKVELAQYRAREDWHNLQMRVVHDKINTICDTFKEGTAEDCNQCYRDDFKTKLLRLQEKLKEMVKPEPNPSCFVHDESISNGEEDSQVEEDQNISIESGGFKFGFSNMSLPDFAKFRIKTELEKSSEDRPSSAGCLDVIRETQEINSSSKSPTKKSSKAYRSAQELHQSKHQDSFGRGHFSKLGSIPKMKNADWVPLNDKLVPPNDSVSMPQDNNDKKKLESMNHRKYFAATNGDFNKGLVATLESTPDLNLRKSNNSYILERNSSSNLSIVNEKKEYVPFKEGNITADHLKWATTGDRLTAKFDGMKIEKDMNFEALATSRGNLMKGPVGSLKSTPEFQCRQHSNLSRRNFQPDGAQGVKNEQWGDFVNPNMSRINSQLPPLHRTANKEFDGVKSNDTAKASGNETEKDINGSSVSSSFSSGIWKIGFFGALNSTPELNHRNVYNSCVLGPSSKMSGTDTQGMKNEEWGQHENSNMFSINSNFPSLHRKAKSECDGTNALTTSKAGDNETINSSSVSSSVSSGLWKKGIFGSLSSTPDLKQKKRYNSLILNLSSKTGSTEDMKNEEWKSPNEPNNATARFNLAGLRQMSNRDLDDLSVSNTSRTSEIIKKMFTLDRNKSGDGKGESNTKTNGWIDIQELRDEKLADSSIHSMPTRTGAVLIDDQLNKHVSNKIESVTSIASSLNTAESSCIHCDEEDDTSVISTSHYDEFLIRPSAASTMLRMKSRAMRQGLQTTSFNDFQALKASLRAQRTCSK